MTAQQWRVVGAVTFLITGFLLLSMGGAIVAAPVTVPLMYLAASRHPTRSFRAAAMALSGLTIAEVVWAVTYLTIDEAQPWIWLLPSLAAFAAAAVFRQLSPAPPHPKVG
jgi:hypothetical protein